jgi:hypothetical protein
VYSAPVEEHAVVYTFSAAANENDNDFSYPVTGNIAETGTFAYFPQGLTQNEKIDEFFSGNSAKEKAPPPAPRGTDIIVSGLLKTRGLFDDGFVTKIQSKNPNGGGYFSDIAHNINYVWEGEIAFDGKNKKSRFDIYTHVLDGVVKLIETYRADKQKTGVEFMYAVTDADTVLAKPPFKWGIFQCDAASYSLYSGVETNYYATYPSFHPLEWNTARWRYAAPHATHIDTYFTFFLKPAQKFQLVNQSGAVVAEIFGNIYTIYDTLPESDWDSMKENMALFYVYRLIARRFFYAEILYF